MFCYLAQRKMAGRKMSRMHVTLKAGVERNHKKIYLMMSRSVSNKEILIWQMCNVTILRHNIVAIQRSGFLCQFVSTKIRLRLKSWLIGIWLKEGNLIYKTIHTSRPVWWNIRHRYKNSGHCKTQTMEAADRELEFFVPCPRDFVALTRGYGLNSDWMFFLCNQSLGSWCKISVNGGR